MKHLFFFHLATLATLLCNNSIFARQYFVNSVSGNDKNSGLHRQIAWKSLIPIHTTNFQPGDTINFESGSVWNSGLEISSNGTQTHPIVYRTIGEGNKPVFTNPGKISKAINIMAKWIIIEGFLVKDASLAGIYLAKGADFNIVRNCEIFNCGSGVMMHGRHNLITHNYAHDLVMVKNTQGGDDDYGAVAYWVFASNNEIAYNRALRCRAPSYDYGADGGFFEIYTNGDSSNVHHNYAEDCNGFLEVGGGSARNVKVTDNISLDNGEFCFHLGKNFRADIQNFRLENNTIITKKGTKWNSLLDWSGGTPEVNTLIMRNNIIILGGGKEEKISESGTFTHENNSYFLLDGAQLGYKTQRGELVTSSN